MSNYNKKSHLIQLIHIAKSDLGLDDETYRDQLALVTGTWSATGELIKAGKRSSAKMTIAELNAVLAHFKSKGFAVKKPKTAGKLKQADDPQSTKIRHLWLELHNLGAVKNPSEQALAKYVENQVGVSALQFLSTANASHIIERLKNWRYRIIKAQAKA